MFRVLLVLCLTLTTAAYAKNLDQQLESFFKEDEAHEQSRNYVTYNKADLVAVNKATGESKILKLVTGQTASWRDLLVRVLRCTDPPANSVGGKQIELVVWDGRRESSKPIFRDWLFQFQPAISSFEHHKYDLLLEECYTD